MVTLISFDNINAINRKVDHYVAGIGLHLESIPVISYCILTQATESEKEGKLEYKRIEVCNPS